MGSRERQDCDFGGLRDAICKEVRWGMRGGRRRRTPWTTHRSGSRSSPPKNGTGVDLAATYAKSPADQVLLNGEMKRKALDDASVEGESGSPNKAKKMNRDKKNFPPTAVSANYHTYQSLDEAWKHTDEGFANLTNGDIDFLEKLYASQRDSAASLYFLKSRGTKSSKENKSSLYFDEPVAMECITTASICPPPQQTLVDDWVDPGDKKRTSVMQVVAARGSADEYLFEEIRSKSADMRNRTGTSFERSALETNIMHINQKDLVEELETFPEVVEELKAISPSSRKSSFSKKNQQKSTERRQSSRVSSTSSPPPSYTADRRRDKKSNKVLFPKLNGISSPPSKKLPDESEDNLTTILGTRQRFYLDQWVEEDYLEKSKQTHLFAPMRMWGDLLLNYSDNHDGFYREWMQARIVPQTHYDDPSKKARKNRKTVVVLPPPAPSSVHHPAAWGVNTRVVLPSLKSRNGFFEKVHPACASTCEVLPPGHYFPDHVDDIDSLNIEHEFLRQQLVSQETNNFLALKKVKDVALRARGLTGLEEKRESLQRNIYSLFKVMTTTNIRNKAHLDFNLHPLRTEGDDHEKAGDSIDAISDTGSIVSDTSSGDGTSKMAPPSRRSAPQLLSTKSKALGGCPVTHIPHGNVLQNLQVGDLCDALLSISVNASVKRWTVCVARQLDFEGGAELRNIKLSRAGAGIVGDCEWIAVEDGRIMPLHTHTSPSQQVSAFEKVEKQRTKRMQTSLALFTENSDVFKRATTTDINSETKGGIITPTMSESSHSFGALSDKQKVEQETLCMDDESAQSSLADDPLPTQGP